MREVRNIREFTVAVSNKLMETNWRFNSEYSRTKGMTFTLDTRLQDHRTELNIIADSKSSAFLLQVILDNRLIHTLSFDPKEDIDTFVTSIVSYLEKIRDRDIEIKL